MEKGTHGKNEVSFEELSYADQAKSLNAQISILGKALNAHVRKGDIMAKNTSDTKKCYIQQLEKIIENLI
jgi:hypothetical protein